MLVAASPAGASPIYDTAAPMSGMRTVATPGLTTDDTDWLDAELLWSIVDNSDNTYTYTYTLKHFDRPGVSHLTLDITNDAVSGDSFADSNAVTGFKFNGSSSSAIEAGDKNGIIGAVKFDIGADGDSLTYSFISNRLPVYGDVFVKGGQSSLTNTGFGDHDSETRTATDFVARPNGAIPEPGTLVLLACSGLGMLRKRRCTPRHG